MSYIVTINRPYYPAVNYVDTLHEAEALHDELVKENSCLDGYHKNIKVTIAEVISTMEITTSY
jgi:hypothetical protein